MQCCYFSTLIKGHWQGGDSRAHGPVTAFVYKNVSLNLLDLGKTLKSLYKPRC